MSTLASRTLKIALTPVLFGMLLLPMPHQAWGSGGGVEPIPEFTEPAIKPDPTLYGKIAVLQWAPPVSPIGITAEQAQQIKMRNSEYLVYFIDQAIANGAVMVVTSEMGVVGYPDIPELPSADDNFRNREDIWPYLEAVPNGPTTKYFSEIAKNRHIYIQFALAEYDAETDRLYNTAVLVDNEGRFVGKHRKQQLFELENNYFTPGTDFNVFQTPFGPMGLLICADVYNSQLLSFYRSKGVKVLSLSTSWAQYNTGMLYFRRAAGTVGAHLLAANQPYFPDSGVVNPDGSLQSHIRQTDGLAYGYLPYVQSKSKQKLFSQKLNEGSAPRAARSIPSK